MLLLFVDADGGWLVGRKKEEEVRRGLIICLGSVAACLWFYSSVQVGHNRPQAATLSIRLKEHMAKEKNTAARRQSGVEKIRKVSKNEIPPLDTIINIHYCHKHS